jgi:hypothetical protein
MKPNQNVFRLHYHPKERKSAESQMHLVQKFTHHGVRVLENPLQQD